MERFHTEALTKLVKETWGSWSLIEDGLKGNGYSSHSPSPCVSALYTVWVAPPDAGVPPGESSPHFPSPVKALGWLEGKCMLDV